MRTNALLSLVTLCLLGPTFALPLSEHRNVKRGDASLSRRAGPGESWFSPDSPPSSASSSSASSSSDGDSTKKRTAMVPSPQQQHQQQHQPQRPPATQQQAQVPHYGGSSWLATPGSQGTSWLATPGSSQLSPSQLQELQRPRHQAPSHQPHQAQSHQRHQAPSHQQALHHGAAGTSQLSTPSGAGPSGYSAPQSQAPAPGDRCVSNTLYLSSLIHVSS